MAAKAYALCAAYNDFCIHQSGGIIAVVDLKMSQILKSRSVACLNSPLTKGYYRSILYAIGVVLYLAPRRVLSR